MAVALVSGMVAHLPQMASASEKVRLDFVESMVVFDRNVGFTEPSGLAMAPDCSHLWSVSDNAREVVRLGLDGKVQPDGAIALNDVQMEGVVLSPDGQRLFLARETGNEVLSVDIATENVVVQRRIRDMDGYAEVATLFEGSPKNKGLEGIAVDPNTGEVLVLKEGEPRLLLRLSPDLGAIIGHQLLNRAKGFSSARANDKKLDVSGIAYDPVRGLYWVVSDQGRQIFLMDGVSGRATHSPLLATIDGEEVEITHAEGVAFCPSTGRLYVITDDGKSSRLFTYQVE